MMKKANSIAVVEVPNEGLVALLGREVMIFCANYIYAGTLEGVNTSCVKLVNAKIVYETGPFTSKGYKDAQQLPGGDWYVQSSAIESFGIGK